MKCLSSSVLGDSCAPTEESSLSGRGESLSRGEIGAFLSYCTVSAARTKVTFGGAAALKLIPGASSFVGLRLSLPLLLLRGVSTGDGGGVFSMVKLRQLLSLLRTVSIDEDDLDEPEDDCLELELLAAPPSTPDLGDCRLSGGPLRVTAGRLVKTAGRSVR